MEPYPTDDDERRLRAERWRELLDAFFTDHFDTLHARARRAMAGEAAALTLQPTALLNEAFARLASGAAVDVRDHEHILRLAATTLRRILVERARARGRARRGGGDQRRRETLSGVEAPIEVDAAQDDAGDVLLLDEALSELGTANSRAEQVVELRYFGGRTTAEIAHMLGLSTRAIEKDWSFAKAWLSRWFSRRGHAGA